MNNDILAEARNRIINDYRVELPNVPSKLRETWERPAGVAGMLIGMATGTKIGAGLGIAGGPLGAIAGTIPCAIVGGIIGYFGAAKGGSKVKK